MHHSLYSKIVFFLLLISSIILFSGYQGMVDVYLVSGEVRCNPGENKTDNNNEIIILKEKLKTGGKDGFLEIGNVSFRYTQPDFRETALELLKAKALKCGARMLYLHPVKRIYNKINVEASGESTGALHPSMYEQTGTMYRSRR